MNRLALFSLTALTISAFAEDEIAAEYRSPSQTKTAPQSTTVTLASASPQSSNGWYFFADALYWHADVGSTDWAWKIDNFPTQVQSGPLHHLDFKWAWGFRAGIGMTMEHDDWDSNFYYTWFHTHNSNSVGVSPLGVIIDNIGTVGPLPDPINSGTINWDVRFSMFDWELGRWFYVSKFLALRPHVGVKGGWIHQPVRLRYTVVGGVGVKGINHLSNNFWGVGASAGFNTEWVLGFMGAQNQHRFCFLGDFAGALLYGHFDVDYSQKIFNAAGAVVSDLHPTNLGRNLEVTMLQGMLGFSYDAAFNRDRSHFTFRFGYEFQYWFRQNQLINVQSSPINFHLHRLSDDLGLQGLTADFRFDF
jgi:hypothetical protein